jgi:glycosyltransferase involved in cell wall biosynthesis
VALLEAGASLRRAVRRLAGRGGNGAPAEVPPAANGLQGVGARAGGNGGGLAGFLRELLTTPDGYAGWFLPGLLQGLWAVLRHRPRVLYSTSPPPTAHLIGYVLSRATGLPWVMDFRDPWTLQWPDEVMARRRGRWAKRMERRLVARAARVICNTEPLAEALRAAYPGLPPEHFFVITNGFDPADFPPLPPPPANGPYRFTHTGEFFPGDDLRVPDPFLAALAELVEEGSLRPEAVRLRLVGSGEYTAGEAFRRFASRPALADVLDVVDFMPHVEIPGELARAHCLLLFQNSPLFHMQVPAKTFEYIRAERPILAVAPPGATQRLVESVRGGVAVSPEDHEGLKAAIRSLVAGRGEAPRRDAEELDRFSRPGLTRRLAALLDTLAGAPAPAGSGEGG